MKAIKIVLVLIFVGFIVSCSKTYNVKSNYDRQVNFADLKTYDWLTVPESATLDKGAIQNIKNAVNTQLKAKGLAAASSNPDFLIAEHVGKQSKVETTDWGYGYRPHRETMGGYGGGYSGASKPTLRQYEEGVLILDFIDPKTKEMIWRGSVKAEIKKGNTPEKSEKLINEAVRKILRNYPPAK
jgi:hypothetical protein